ncbi:uncharacterized protein F5147DRAFT_47681 [Suillus discolor]|uniref:C2H2-type domain-containing protein n=1 Tax=Suillus discolor TaxID=1912936 RepID=A0A9P7JWJ3_9AGAM|nr:uncharacterized protein F5147DRAFT_47681 [Suillus discolor]KAG2113496.1 hypothetical protein F5147DRAFT_47681 [Suillus discolor]
MTTTSQPIAFQSPNHPDLHIPSGSFTGNNSAMPYFLGSPISWRAGSFGSRFYPGCSPGQLLGPLDPNEFKCAKLSSSIDSDRGSILNALGAFDRDDELCRNYTCCGLQLDDLHALLQHFEEIHVVVLDPFSHPQFPVVPPLPQYTPNATPSYFSDHHQHPSSYNQGGFDPDDMELDVDQGSTPSSNAPSPPDTPLTTPLSSHPSHSFNHFGQSKPASPHLPVSAFDTTTVHPSRSVHGSAFPPSRNSLPNVANAPDAFNGYAGYSDYSSSMPGTVPSPPASDDLHAPVTPVSDPGSPYGCLPPAVVFSTSNTPVNTPSASRVPSPTSASRYPAASAASPHSPDFSASSKAFSSQQANQRASTTLSRPASSLLLSKPFRCPKPNCNKSYKQANGLKYHMTHGSCNFAPPKDLEQVQALLASKRSAREAAGQEDQGITEGEMREVEREAERRLRPFACGVSDCQRRYKNMNGLRYHYQHSGDHGAMGLSLLASGQHECLQHAHGRSSNASSRHSTPATSGHSTPVNSSTPSYAQQYQQQMLYSSAQQQYLRQQQQALHAQVQMGYSCGSTEAVAAIIAAQH